VVCFGKNDDKLISPKSSNEIDFANVFAEESSDLLKDGIPYGMSKVIVVVLEVVHVCENDRKIVVWGAFCSFFLLVEPILEGKSVGTTCEHIRLGRVTEEFGIYDIFEHGVDLLYSKMNGLEGFF